MTSLSDATKNNQIKARADRTESSFFRKLLQNMVSKNGIDIKRLFCLIRSDSSGSLRLVILICAISVGVMILAARQKFQNWDFFHTFYAPILYLGGCYISSKSFKKIHLIKEATFYYTLPGSLLEKWLSTMIVDYLGFAALFSLSCLILSAILSLVISPITHLYFPVFQLSQPVFLTILYALAYQSFFVLGSLIFKRHAFIKTVAVTIILFFLFMTALSHAGINIASLFFSNQSPLNGNALGTSQGVELPPSAMQSNFFFQVKFIPLMLAPFFLVLGFILFKRKQIV